MITASIEWNEENIKRYVTYTLLGGNKKAKIFIGIYCAVIVLMAAAGVCFAIFTGFYLLTVFAVLAILLAVVFAVILKFALKKYSSDILKLNGENGVNKLVISRESITVYNGEIPAAVIGWDSVASLDFNDGDAYMTMINGLLFIIERDKLVSGDFEELGGLAAQRMVKKDDELSN